MPSSHLFYLILFLSILFFNFHPFFFLSHFFSSRESNSWRRLHRHHNTRRPQATDQPLFRSPATRFLRFYRPRFYKQCFLHRAIPHFPRFPFFFVFWGVPKFWSFRVFVGFVVIYLFNFWVGGGGGSVAESALKRFSGNGSPGYEDGDVGSAQFNKPRSFAIDLRGNVYVADRVNQVIRKISANGIFAE